MSQLERALATHDGRLMAHVDELPKLADGIHLLSRPALLQLVDEERSFLDGTLLTHLTVVEATIHTQLHRSAQCADALDALRAEHARIRSLVARLDSLVGKPTLEAPDARELEAVLTTLYARLRAHLRDELDCALLLEGSLSADEIAEMTAAMDRAYVRAA